MNLLSSLLKYTADQIAALRAKDTSQDTTVSGINTRLTTAEGDIDSLEAQFTTVVSAVTTDTEVTNIRVGDDGVTYDTAGNAVRAQFSDVKSDINGRLPMGDLIEKRYIDGNGNQAYYNGWSCTDFINVTDYDAITIVATVGSDYNSFYDSSKGHIGNFSLVSGFNEIELSSNTAYIRLSNTDSAMEATAILSHIGKLRKDIDDNATNIAHTNDYVLLNVDAQKNGYYKAVNLKWESGSFNIPSGTDKNPDVNVIRTPLPRLQFAGDVKVLMVNDSYRFRIIGASDASSPATFDSGWYWGYGDEYTLNVNTSMYYRIQIATKSATSMDMDEALQSLLFVYADDSMSAIKPFWESYIEDKVQAINSYMTDGTNKTAFLFLTDTHWNESPSQLNSCGINSPLMRYVKDRCNIDYVVHGGDLNSEYRSNRNIARELMTKPMALMRDAFGHVLVTRGNHDDNNEGGNDSWNYTITQSDSYSYMFRNTKDVVFGATGTYFYHDIPFDKIRIISLDCADFPYTNDVDSAYIDEKLLAYGYTQLQWLCDTLKNTPNGYHIVIYTHAMIAPSIVTVEHPNDSPQTRAKNAEVVARILRAYKNRADFSLDITGWFTAIHQSYYDGVLSDDFSDCSATIVGVFSGHEHIDCIEEIEIDGTGIGIYNTCTQNSSAMFGDSVISHSYQHPMEIGTTSELVWDMVVIDRANKRVDMIRIGANGANTDVEEFNVRGFNYA